MIRNTLMFLFLAAVCVFSLVSLFGCDGSPLAPTAHAQSHENGKSYVPLHHNIPATFVGQERGPMVWLCATQPRLVCEGEATSIERCVREEDHYLQYRQCPATPIR